MNAGRTAAADNTRARIVAAAAGLLTKGGREAVSTRAVSAAAGVQAPTIYRLFGDKQGLLEAVASHGFTTYLNLNPFSGPMVSLPLFTFKMSQSPEGNYISRAFGAAALLLVLVLLLFAFSRWMAGRGRSGSR